MTNNDQLNIEDVVKLSELVSSWGKSFSGDTTIYSGMVSLPFGNYKITVKHYEEDSPPRGHLLHPRGFSYSTTVTNMADSELFHSYASNIDSVAEQEKAKAVLNVVHAYFSKEEKTRKANKNKDTKDLKSFLKA
ncbi:hypothetical protein HY837_02400 [archaeon]|nr:hypothetical protein [archaeon]